jgi:hypothetical protein
MSNCIEFYRGNEVVKFPAVVIDAENLKAAIKQHQDHCQHPSVHDDPNWKAEPFKGHQWTEVHGECSMIYWYLNDQNVEINLAGDVTVHFGKARSSHTWRDFKGVGEIICQVLKCNYSHAFWIQDEMDRDTNYWERYIVTFNKDSKKVEMKPFGSSGQRR